MTAAQAAAGRFSRLPVCLTKLVGWIAVISEALLAREVGGAGSGIAWEGVGANG
jgi:hypothetical protein